MTYKRFVYGKRRHREPLVQLDGKVRGSERFYTRDPKVLELATDNAYPYTQDEEFLKGGTFLYNPVDPIIDIKNYLSDAPPNDKRTTCITCKFSGDPIKLDDKHYKVWCKQSFKENKNFNSSWKYERYDQKTNPCQEWYPRNIQCIA